MNNRIGSTIILFLSAALAGCSTLRVTRGDSENVPGVPFYTKVHERYQETAWSEINFRVELMIELFLQDLAKPIHTISLGLAQVPEAMVMDSVQMNDLRHALANTAPPSPDIEDRFSAFADAARTSFQAMHNADGIPQRKVLSLVQNRLATRTRVGSEIYYINSTLPFIGSGIGEFDLSSDQTLTKVKSEAESRTPEALLPSIPIKEYLSKKLELSPQETMDEIEARALYADLPQASQRLVDTKKAQITRRYKLSVEPEQRIWLLAMQSSTLTTPIEPSKASAGGVEVSVTKLVSEEKKEKEASPAYNFSGGVVLPKDEKPEDKK